MAKELVGSVAPLPDRARTALKDDPHGRRVPAVSRQRVPEPLGAHAWADSGHSRAETTPDPTGPSPYGTRQLHVLRQALASFVALAVAVTRTRTGWPYVRTMTLPFFVTRAVQYLRSP